VDTYLVLFGIFAAIAAGLIIADNDARSKVYLSQSWRGRIGFLVLALVVDWAGLFWASPNDLLRGGLLAFGGVVSVFALLIWLPMRWREGITSRDNVGLILLLGGAVAFVLSGWTMSFETRLMVALSSVAIIIGYAMLSRRKPKEEAA